jgi:prevent-host-death family protein
LSKVKAKFSAIIDLVDRRRKSVVVTRHGQPVAVILSASEYAGWQETADILSDREFLKEIRAGMRALKRTKKRYTIDHLFAS